MNSSKNMEDLSSTQLFFQELDAGFNGNLNKDDNRPFLYKAQDILIHKEFLLPIPTLAGSIIKYNFTTQNGDIQFGTTFQFLSKSYENILEADRVPSDIETISGCYKAMHDGKFLLVFDNSFSWFTPKSLSYVVELFQVSTSFKDVLYKYLQRMVSYPLFCNERHSQRSPSLIKIVVSRVKAC